MKENAAPELKVCPMGTPKDVTNRIVFVLLIAFIAWQLFRIGLLVAAGNGWI